MVHYALSIHISILGKHCLSPKKLSMPSFGFLRLMSFLYHWHPTRRMSIPVAGKPFIDIPPLPRHSYGSSRDSILEIINLYTPNRLRPPPSSDTDRKDVTSDITMSGGETGMNGLKPPQATTRHSRSNSSSEKSQNVSTRATKKPSPKLEHYFVRRFETWCLWI